nr:hypothetical protein [uncultured Lacibacter sp.]
MKKLLPFIFLLCTHLGFGQYIKGKTENFKDRSKSVSFTTVVDIQQATKEGIYMEGYVVHISFDKIKTLHGKKVKVTGKATVVKGLKQDYGKEEKQGRYEETKHLFSPVITILK